MIEDGTGRRLGDGSWHGPDGRLRIAVRVVDWETCILLTLDEMRRLGATSMPVLRRLRAVLEDLHAAVPEGRRGVIEEQLALLDDAAAQAFGTAAERRWAATADVRGAGI
jgi:uncharacterized membrane protein